MKISEFANRYDVSNDTVRYYMELNLLNPEKNGGHYNFDEKCEEQMREILNLKKMDFSLQEIKKIFNFKRIGKLSTYQKNSYYQSIYKNKYQDVEQKIDDLRYAKGQLKEELLKLESINDDKIIKIGIDLSALSLFACPHCNSDLKLTAERLIDNQVIEGSLNCKCGESLQITGGILYSNFNNNEQIGDEHIEKQIEDNHIEEYINEVDPDYIDILYQKLEWLQRQFDFKNIKNKVIMEPGSGSGFFLRQVYNDLSEDNIYICIDKNPYANIYLKQLLEMTDKKAKIIFITANLPEIPLRPNAVDLLVDFTGTSSYSFANEEFLPALLEKYIKKKATMLATYIIYHKFGPNNIVTETYRDNFKYNNIRNNLLKLEFELEKENKDEIEKVKAGYGKYKEFAQPGDQIYAYQVLAKRWG